MNVLTPKIVAAEWLRGERSWDGVLDACAEIFIDPADVMRLARGFFESELSQGHIPEETPRGLLSPVYLLQLREEFPKFATKLQELTSRE